MPEIRMGRFHMLERTRRFIKYSIVRSLLLRICYVIPMANQMILLAHIIKLSRWIRKHRPRLFEKRPDLYRHILAEEDLDGAIEYLEFGVHWGESLKWWIDNNKHEDSRFVGFDSFFGIPERYGRHGIGTMSTDGIPPAIDDKRCSFQIGWFLDTLPSFVMEYKPQHRKVINIDCDLYTSSTLVLTLLALHLRKGDIILLDDFGSLSCADHEFRAFLDFFSSYGIEYEILGAADKYVRVAVKIESEVVASKE